MIKVKNWRHATIFTITITLFAACASVLYDYTMLPADGFERNLVWRIVFAMTLAVIVAVPTASMMIREFKLKQSLEFALTYDALTGTYSRRAIFQRIEATGDRNGLIILADIDHFKSINDRFGHAAGDAVLRHFGVRSRHYLHTTLGEDIAAIGRVGGEEFLIYINTGPYDDLAAWIDGMREAIRDAPMLDGVAAYPLTASYGVTRLDGNGMDSAMIEADEALYAAKNAGRDRAVFSDRLHGQIATETPDREARIA